jgi:succinyl-diaminopimelate desuccinylase
MSYESYIASHRDDFESRLFEVLRFPSVSAMEAHRGDVRRTAVWFRNQFVQMGLYAELLESEGHPIVFAEYTPTTVTETTPTLLFYGHYDVQPPDPLDLWKSPPFEPTIRDGNVYARGATDDKGQFLTHVFAVEAILKSQGSLPCKVKFVVEGEEESTGSVSLEKLLNTDDGKRKLACDCIVVSDTSQFASGQPTITYGLRGIVACELFLTGPNRDLHSGTFGGSVFNPAIALTKILSRFTDENGIVQIPQFYDDVIPLTERERSQFAALPFDETEFYAKIGLETGFGEKGYSTVERRSGRPTFDINGITSGYQGEGTKTIIPGKASAKFTCRLVPNQNPEKIAASIRSYIATLVPLGITWELVMQHGAAGMSLDLDKSRFVEPMAKALEQTFGKKPVFTREGGSIPIVAKFHQVLQADVLLVGWGQDDDALHSPNEKFSLSSFHNGILASARFLGQMALVRSFPHFHKPTAKKLG